MGGFWECHRPRRIARDREGAGGARTGTCGNTPRQRPSPRKSRPSLRHHGIGRSALYGTSDSRAPSVSSNPLQPSANFRRILRLETRRRCGPSLRYPAARHRFSSRDFTEPPCVSSRADMPALSLNRWDRQFRLSASLSDGRTKLKMMAHSRVVRAPRGRTMRCKGWPQEGALRMLMNNLDPEVAERPEDLIVYGGTGQAARDWAS